ncbi:dihydrolipoyl dehydrogenase [Clostridium luticellarii]|jgi:dihydrolipoamide dehydrogenase|uniref:dihydrolipoyl dehydrogenase n=1 Tax=Clostridium luticellarii TaxID=1691940 RepID=UPI002356D7CA|nr:dihydrolipoyl dehydrogenase [Clostridium luticellarii]MCI1945090.1 dihydrolipoyl dehydrogenase [Clostridium luticellarii]MCI1968583.1 dihydrolipoyl dehydrogenase [Clostridium luticellarii]MCI1995887.1 dihydrolipoyl dehydrogenase [Clostridium luticellarii]MCI2040957.1 dihydrolipoyl dehydrogenase [Clostridium luticellarii]
MSCLEIMPKLGLTMTEGMLAKWHKSEGEKIEKGEILFEVETDKLTNEIEAKESGVVRKILVEEGETVKCLAPVAVIAGENEDISGLLKEAGVNGQEVAETKTEEKKSDNTAVEAGPKKVVVIGGGPGGYIAAIRAAQLGNKVTLIEKEELGGTCLNVGCIPTKTLLHSAELFSEIKDSRNLGIDVGEVSINWKNVQRRRKRVIKKLVSGVKGLLSYNKVNVINGFARMETENSLTVSKEGGKSEKIDFDSAIISTGSVPFAPLIPGIGLEGVIDSTGALELESLPETIVIIGGGVIGIEFASLFSSLGKKVTILEMLPFILPPIDRQISSMIADKLSKQGVSINTGCRVTSIEKGENGLKVDFTKGNDNLNVEAEKVLVAIGRRSNTEGLELEKIGVKTEKGRVCVDDYMRTNAGSIYAIGDCTGKIMLAHVASEQGVVAAENISGKNVKMDYKTVPSCVYTKPEIASTGLTEEQVKEKGIDYKVGIFPMGANGKAMISKEPDGIIKIIADKKTEEILGVHIMAPRATDFIGEAALALRLEATVDEVVTTIHAHPTINEAFKEAALAVQKRALNSVN